MAIIILPKARKNNVFVGKPHWDGGFSFPITESNIMHRFVNTRVIAMSFENVGNVLFFSNYF